MRGVTTFTRQMPRFCTTVRTTGRDAGTSRQITVLGPVGLRVSRTRTGMSASTAGWSVAGWSTLPPQNAISAASS